MISLLSNKWIYTALAFFILVSIGLFLINKSYHNGYKTGVEVTEGRYDRERLEWIERVDNIQESHEKNVNEILVSYNEHIASLEDQVETIQSQDPIIKTKYIHKYVPIEVNCTIPKGFVELHNTSAKGLSLQEPTDPLDSTNLSLQEVGSTVAINYYQYNKIVAQLKALQEIVIDFQIKQKEMVK